MVHANNCTSDLNAWVGLFADFLKAAHIDMDMNTLFKTLYNEALKTALLIVTVLLPMAIYQVRISLQCLKVDHYLLECQLQSSL